MDHGLIDLFIDYTSTPDLINKNTTTTFLFVISQYFRKNHYYGRCLNSSGGDTKLKKTKLIPEYIPVMSSEGRTHGNNEDSCSLEIKITIVQ